jgi:hypothetical protein
MEVSMKKYLIITFLACSLYSTDVVYGWELYGDSECVMMCTQEVWVDGSYVMSIGYGSSGEPTYVGNYSGTHKVGVYSECGVGGDAITCANISASNGDIVVAYLDTCFAMTTGTGHITVNGVTQPEVSCEVATTTTVDETTTTSIDDDDKGGLGETCYEDGTCNEGLICVGTTCLNCPIAFALEGDEAQLDIIRDFRDNVLNQTPEGKEIIRLYYEWSPVIVKAMEEDEQFKEQVKEMADGVLEMIE